jgi:hypothetical protein
MNAKAQRRRDAKVREKDTFDVVTDLGVREGLLP